jgi:hypothetical protein
MKVEDIIEGLNRHIENKRRDLNIEVKGHIVLQKEININSSFKAYKNYRYTVWFTNGKSYRLITVSQSARVLDGQEEFIERQMNTILCESIFDWIGSKYYDEVIKGEYNGVSEDRNEQISN